MSNNTINEMWCMSKGVPVLAGLYSFDDGEVVRVKQSRKGKFYATSLGKHVPGLIFVVRSELDAGRARMIEE